MDRDEDMTPTAPVTKAPDTRRRKYTVIDCVQLLNKLDRHGGGSLSFPIYAEECGRKRVVGVRASWAGRHGSRSFVEPAKFPSLEAAELYTWWRLSHELAQGEP